MSKVFDALRKRNAFDLGEISRLDTPEQKKQVWRPIDSTTAITPSSWSRNTTRVVPLCISVRSPILPFDKEQQAAAAEQYKIIRTKILHHPDKPQFILISSAAMGDGKTVTAINLAGSLALKQDMRVLLLDGDLRRPRIADALGIPGVPGLADLLSGSADMKSTLMRAEQFPNLFILPAGRTELRAAELLDSLQWQTLIQQIRATFSIVICDGPPIATVADYELLELTSDRVIVVTRPDHTDRALCMKGLRAISQSKLLGVVLNCVENWWLWKAPVYSYQVKEFATEVPKRPRPQSFLNLATTCEGAETHVRES